MRVAGLLIALLVLLPADAGAQSGDAAPVLARLGERVRQYYDRVTSIMCTETVRQQELRSNLRPVGRPRDVVYELIVVRTPDERGAHGPIRVERTLKSINGREARRSDRPGCTDPKAIAAEPLDFLLPERQYKYKFAVASRGRGAVVVDFEEYPPQPVDVTWEGACFNAEGGGAKGRLWLDPQSYDVQQLEVRLPKPFRIRLPAGLGFLSAPPLTVERSETKFQFSRVKFENPDEAILLLESMETLTVFHGAPSLRTTQNFSNFRRFLSEIRITGSP
jgi:hypothetical protein